MNLQPPTAPAFGPDEACVLSLRALYESRGYLRVPVPKFEDYTLYADNKNFLGTDNVLTFTDPRGRLLALKPDVTLSIARSLPDQPRSHSEKLYYLDEVYRLTPDKRAYKVHGQVGVELCGEPGDGFADLEVLDLARQSLKRIGEPFALDISHLGFVRGLLRQADLPGETEGRIIALIHQKNTHDVSALLAAAGVEEALRQRIVTLAGLHGPFAEALERARALVSGPGMEAAFGELARVNAVLGGNGRGVNLDFSVVNDLAYYNAIIFRGYVQGVPSVVLSGGRYDNLLARMHKPGGAVGFAVWLDQLGEYLGAAGEPRFDLLVLYGPDADWAGLLAALRELAAQGKSVRCERAGADLSGAGFGWEKAMRYTARGLEEVPVC